MKKLITMLCAGGILCSLLLLSGCGMQRGDRTLSGAGFGAGFGSLLALATSTSPVAGAAVGCLLGGTIGYTYPPEELNLGKPLWRTRY